MQASGKDSRYWMREALELAKMAGDKNEVPVGAIVVLGDEIIGRGFNSPICLSDPTAHAEIIALRDAAKTIGNYRLVDADLYVTIEPCTMCAGAIIHSRIRKLYYGAAEAKSGVIESQMSLFSENWLNHKVLVESAILEQECRSLITSFFSRRRAEKKERKASGKSD